MRETTGNLYRQKGEENEKWGDGKRKNIQISVRQRLHIGRGEVKIEIEKEIKKYEDGRKTPHDIVQYE